MLLAFLCCSIDSVIALVFYVIIYSCLTITVFSLLINCSVSAAVQPKYLINLSAIGSKNYIFAATFALNILAIAGIPPLSGFFSKFFILFSVIEAKYYFTAIIIVMLSSIACFYYIRLVKIMFFVKHSKNSIWITNSTRQNTEIFIGFFLFVAICYFLHPNLFINFSIVLGLAIS